MNLEYYKKKFPFIVTSLQNARKNNRLAHAYLIYCDDIELKKDLPFFVAKLLLCPDADSGKVPCGICNICQKIERKIYPDLYCIEPTSKSRKIVIGESSDDSGTLRWFQARFSLTSMSAGWKIGIILDADSMMPQSQNAFLKTLEEPPKKTFFILVSGKPHSLSPTILSRCQLLPVLTNKCIYSFEDSGQLFALLQNLTSAEPKTLSLADQCANELVAMFESLHDKAENMVKQKFEKIIEQAEYFDSSENKKQLNERYAAIVEAEYRLLREYFLNAIYVWFAQLYQLSCGIGFDLLANPEIMPEEFKSNLKLTSQKALRYLKYVEKLLEYLQWNVSEKLAIQEFCLKMVLKI